MDQIFTIEAKIRSFVEVNIPSNTEIVDATNCGLTSFEGLPSSVKDLRCSHNPGIITLSTIPPSTSLERLDVSYCRLVDLTGLPSSVTALRCRNNRITSLQGIPQNSHLRSLGISYNHLQNFIGCPSTVSSIVAVFNQITSLQGLPPTMADYLYLANNALTSCAHCSAVPILDVVGNDLISLEGCPEGIIELQCACNRLTSLHGCPSSVKIIRCSHNPHMSDYSAAPPTLQLIEYTGHSRLDLPSSIEQLKISTKVHLEDDGSWSASTGSGLWAIGQTSAEALHKLEDEKKEAALYMQGPVERIRPRT